MQRAIILLILIWISACATAPITGRTQWNLVNRNRLTQDTHQAMDALMGEVPISQDHTEQQKIKLVGCRLVDAVDQYLLQNNLTLLTQNFEWEFILTADTLVNAFCLPGGKIFIFEGILPYCKSDDELAVLLGHEIAHAVAHHGAESLSKALAGMLGAVAVSTATLGEGAELSEASGELYSSIAEISAFSNSRVQEREADYLGLLFMSRAGYNPACAVAFWEAMQTDQGSKAFDLYNTHPTHSRRIKELQHHLPMARALYDHAHR